MRDNCIRSLADGDPFLDRFAVNRTEDRIVVFDDELDEKMGRRWLRLQGIKNIDRVSVVFLRGKVSTFNLLDEDTLNRWADRLRSVGAGIVVLDCLRAVLAALGLSEDKDAGLFLVAFDELLNRAGASEAIVVHHAGHGAERSRGDSRIRDWPDVEWTLVRESPDGGGGPEPNARRFFKAYGRDVDVPEGLLEFDESRHRLRFAGGSRRETAADGLIPELLEYLIENPEASGRQIETALVPPLRRGAVRQALRRAVESGRIKTSPGPKRSTLHNVADAPVRQCAEVRHQCASAQESECASAPIGAHGAHTHSEEASAPSAHTDDSEVDL